MRVCTFYKIETYVCDSVAKARGLLLMQLAQERTSAVAARTYSAAGGDDGDIVSPQQQVVPATIVLVDLDCPGVTEESCIEELCTLMPLRLLYIYSHSSEGHLASAGNSSLAAASAASAATPALCADNQMVSSPGSAGSGLASHCGGRSLIATPNAASLALTLPKRCYAMIRKSLRKPFKVRVLLCALLALMAAPFAHMAVTPSDISASRSSGSAAAATTDMDEKGSSPLSPAPALSDEVEHANNGMEEASAPAALSAPVAAKLSRQPRIVNVGAKWPLRYDSR
jgi:hypothetical protein